jgi:6-phosphogluconate dehydrogenase
LYRSFGLDKALGRKYLYLSVTIKFINMKNHDFGIVGLGVMGRNLGLNIADHNFSVVGMTRDPKKTAAFLSEADDHMQVSSTTDPATFVSLLKSPRAIMLMVPAGDPVDESIATLVPLLDKGDIIVDGGNSYFPDTDRRFIELEAKGIHFFGMGVSGGENGARFGPSMMPGGDKKAYERLRPIFEAVSAKVEGEPCVTYLGNGSAGNYVKMVHNGIEYGIMQLIAETYDILRKGLKLNDAAIQDVFSRWNETNLQSFLIEITGKVLSKFDDHTSERLVSMISDVARSKGTGKWTSQNAMDLQVPVPTIDAAVNMRDLSKNKSERLLASQQLIWEKQSGISEEESVWVDRLQDALYFAIVNTYAQGLAQLQVASVNYDYGLNLEDVTRIWRGGCIIRSVSLEDFRQAYMRDPKLPNLLLDKEIGSDLSGKQASIRETVKLAVDLGLPVPAFMASLSYFDAYRSATLPTNLIQAQRDYFGAHLYERIDGEGTHHSQWD